MIWMDIPRNPALLKAIEDAAGGGLIAALRDVDMTGHGSDLNIAFADHNDHFGRIYLDVQLDSMRGGGISLMDKDAPVMVDRAVEGLTRRVTIAPQVWFQHTGNAASAVNPLYLDDLILITNEPTSTVIWHGVQRARDKFKALAKPKRELPCWVPATR
jgi:hypothetical protein